jgi:phosphoribosyl 1,2-cyclic phosphodiesterase
MDAGPHTLDENLSLRFWGVRGSTPTPVARNLRYGGNTPCVSVKSNADQLLIFDAGTGIRALGAALVQQTEPPRTLHLFFTHFHWDHLQGLPFFAPLFRKDTRLILHSARPPAELRSILARQMSTPFFPVDFTTVPSELEFRQITTGAINFGDLSVQAFPLHHPQGAHGYRIANGRKSMVFATDHEHGDSSIDANLRAIARNADVLVYDAQYTPAEYASRQGWGHSTWQQGVRAATDAQVNQLVLFHHDPDHDDSALDAIVEVAQQQFPQTIAASENTTV